MDLNVKNKSVWKCVSSESNRPWFESWFYFSGGHFSICKNTKTIRRMNWVSICVSTQHNTVNIDVSFIICPLFFFKPSLLLYLIVYTFLQYSVTHRREVQELGEIFWLCQYLHCSLPSSLVCSFFLKRSWIKIWLLESDEFPLQCWLFD